MRKISSAIFLVTLFVFANCKNNAGETAEEDQKNKFYQSIINLGNGFIDVFSSLVGSIAEALGTKANPKKSDVKTYFDSIAKKLEETLQSLEKLNKENEEASEATVESAVGKTIEWLKEMIGAAKKGGEKNDGGGENIGNVEANNNGAKGNEESVKAIASGMKGIVEAAKKAGVELKAAAVAGGGNKDAGKLFATNGGGHAHANTAAINNAAKAVSGVSGDQILNAIVTSGDGNDENAGNATNPIDAAIGAAGNDDQGFNGMTADDKIAAAIVLRGMAKDGKFALADAADASKESLKATVESAVGKTIEWLKEM
ncbi:variable large family protein, partial [Borreliella garinii]|uniref:variable large family protein n=1 Tax=Borreliella garinii TaxID=29519 RepID=UPI001AEFB887